MRQPEPTGIVGRHRIVSLWSPGWRTRQAAFLSAHKLATLGVPKVDDEAVEGSHQREGGYLVWRALRSSGIQAIVSEGSSAVHRLDLKGYIVSDQMPRASKAPHMSIKMPRSTVPLRRNDSLGEPTHCRWWAWLAWTADTVSSP